MTRSKHFGQIGLWAFLFILLSGSLWSCKRPEPIYSTASQEEVAAFSAELELALNTKDAAFFIERCDHRRFTDYCYQQMLNSRELDAATSEIKTGFTFGEYFLGESEGVENDIARMLSIRKSRSNYYVFFRRIDTDCNYQYIQARIERREDENDSRTVLTDFLPHNMGEWFSEVVGESLRATSDDYPQLLSINNSLADEIDEMQNLGTNVPQKVL